MKKQLFTIACLILSMAILAQEQTRKFTPSIKFGDGIWTEEPSVGNLNLGNTGRIQTHRSFFNLCKYLV